MADRDKCGATGKLRFASKDEAQSELRRFGHAKGSRCVYFCIFCDGYHMTKNQRGNRKRGR